MKTFKYITFFALMALLLVGCTFESTAAVVSPTPAPTEAPTPVPVQEQIVIIQTEPPLDDSKVAEMNSVLKRATFLDGVTVNGVSIGGMTIAEAEAAVAPAIAAAKADYAITVSDPTAPDTDPVVFSGADIAMNDNLSDVLSEAFALVREDVGYDEVMAQVQRIANGMPFSVDLSFDESALRSAVNVYADEKDVAPVNASVAYNSADNAIDYTDDEPGKAVDRDALTDALLNASDGDTVEAVIAEQEAEVTRENVESRFVLRGKKTTSFKGSTSNRKYNIKKGVGLITGTILHPGDVFSANDTLGVRNKSNGWKLAGAYNSGTTVQEYGGGVCQLSSTLYNAVVKADLEIVYRQNHSMPVSYIDKGLDATINSVGNMIDFKFKNNSKSDIIIIGYTDGNELTFEIYGISLLEESDGEYDQVKIPTPKKIKTLSPSGEKEVEVDYSKPVGYREETQERRNGYVYQSYKQYYLNGEMVKEEELAVSTYKAYAGKIIVGPSEDTSTSNNSGGNGSNSGSDSNGGSNSGNDNGGSNEGSNTGNENSGSNSGSNSGNENSGSNSGGENSGSNSGNENSGSNENSNSGGNSESNGNGEGE